MTWSRARADGIEGFAIGDIFVSAHAVRRYLQRFPAPGATAADIRACLEIHLPDRRPTDRHPLSDDGGEVWEIPDLDMLLIVGFNDGRNSEAQGCRQVVVTILRGDAPTLSLGEALVESIVKPRRRPPARVLRFGMLMVVILGTELVGMGVETPDEDVILAVADWEEAAPRKVRAYAEAGLCRSCGKPAEPGKRHCTRHLDQPRERRAQRKRDGLCIQCAAPVDVAGKARCPTCRRRIADRKKEHGA